MNSQEFRQAARTAFALAMDAYYAVSNDDNATMDALIAADAAKTAADAQWIADQHTANTMAQAELDAATAKGCEEVVEVVSQDFATMTVEALREYAETVQAEYNADELSGAMGRQIVRDAWARLEEAEAKAVEVVSWESALSTAKQTFAVAKSAYLATMSDGDATTEELTAAAHAYDGASAEWVIAQAAANRAAAHA